MIRIICFKDGFRRGGIAHPQGATEYQDDAFTKDQLAQIKADPMFTVEVVKEKAGK